MAILVRILGNNLDMRSLEENCILSPPPLSPRCGISCKFCNVANYIVHCLNAHLMVGEFIISYSCEIQSSGGKFKTSFINRKRNIRKGFILLWIPFDTYTGINLSIQSGGVRIPSIQKVWVEKYQNYSSLWTISIKQNEMRILLKQTERTQILGIWDSFGLRADINVFVLPA